MLLLTVHAVEKNSSIWAPRGLVTDGFHVDMGNQVQSDLG